MKARIYLKGLAATIAGDTNLPVSTVMRVLNSYHDNVIDCVSDGIPVQITGFGKFDRKHRSARNVRNPQTGEMMTVESKDVPHFSAGSEFKKRVDSIGE